MGPFEQASEEIARAFKTEMSTRWVRATGRDRLANALLDGMERAQSQEQFDNLAYQFKRDILMPYYRQVVLPNGDREQRDDFLNRNRLMAMRPRKQLGTYAELQKNPAFAQSSHMMLPPGTRDSVPALLQVAQDPAEMDLTGRELGVTPEDLQEHIWDQYAAKAREQFRKDMLAATMEGQRYRDSLANEYKESMLGGVLGAISPEVTNTVLDAIRKGKDPSSWEYAKAIAKDALVGIGSLYAGAGAGKVVSNPAAQSLLGGVLDAGIEGARQGLSNFSDWDAGNIAATGATSATIPALAGMVTSGLGRLPGLRRFTRPLMKKIYGIDNDPAAMEVAAAQAKRDATRDAIVKAETGDPLAKELETDLLDETRGFIEASPTKVVDGEPVTRDRVRDIVMDQQLADKYFEPPSPEEFSEMIQRRNGKGADDVINIGGRQRYTSDVAEDWVGRAKAQWPETWKNITGDRRQSNFLERHVGDLVDFGSREETMRQRSKGRLMQDRSISVPLQTLMENDPELVRMWQAGFVPNGGPEKELYDEWKAKVAR
jgi:hypothetical protein